MRNLIVLGFVGLWFWAWSARRKEEFDDAARLPLIDGEVSRGSETC